MALVPFLAAAGARVERSGPAVRVADMAGWVDQQPPGDWWSLLREGLEDLFHEVGDRETDRRDVIEWLAEWGRDARKRQTGLLLLSAHRAKGLEFDDMVILDGGWDRPPSNGEDGDAQRRLYYVAMTRARRSLALLSMGDRHPFVDGLDGPAVAHRSLDGKGLDVADCRKIYLTLDPSEVDLDFAGRLADGHRALRSLDRIVAGDAVDLEKDGDRWLIVDRDDNIPIGAWPRSSLRRKGPNWRKSAFMRSQSAFDRIRGRTSSPSSARIVGASCFPNWSIGPELRGGSMCGDGYNALSISPAHTSSSPSADPTTVFTFLCIRGKKTWQFRFLRPVCRRSTFSNRSSI